MKAQIRKKSLVSKKAVSRKDLYDSFREICLNTLTQISHITWGDITINQDYNSIIAARRAEAFVATINEVVRRYYPHTKAKSPKRIKEFVRRSMLTESSLSSTYDEDIKADALIEGIAAWIVEQIKAQNKVPELLAIIPEGMKVTKLHEYLRMSDPELFDIIVYLLWNRNDDCIGFEGQKKPYGKRIYTDLYTATNTHRQNVPSRQRFEALMALIPQEAKEKAAAAYIEKFWDFTKRYYKCKYDILHTQEIKECKTAALERKISRMIRRMNSCNLYHPVLKGSEDEIMDTASSLSETKAKKLTPCEKAVYDAVQEWEEWWCNLYAVIDGDTMRLDKLEDNLDYMGRYSYEEAIEEVGVEAAESWSDYTIKRPHELCFGFFYLLENGSHIPWLYYPGVALVSCLGSIVWSKLYNPYKHLDLLPTT